jgi:hypothetical protein
MNDARAMPGMHFSNTLLERDDDAAVGTTSRTRINFPPSLEFIGMAPNHPTKPKAGGQVRASADES